MVILLGSICPDKLFKNINRQRTKGIRFII